MTERQKLNKELDAATFRSLYYLKQELAGFCKENGLPASGSKAEGFCRSTAGLFQIRRYRHE